MSPWLLFSPNTLELSTALLRAYDTSRGGVAFGPQPSLWVLHLAPTGHGTDPTSATSSVLGHTSLLSLFNSTVVRSSVHHPGASRTPRSD